MCLDLLKCLTIFNSHYLLCYTDVSRTTSAVLTASQVAVPQAQLQQQQSSDATPLNPSNNDAVTTQQIPPIHDIQLPSTSNAISALHFSLYALV